MQGTLMFEAICLFNAVQIPCPRQARQSRLTETHGIALWVLPAVDDDAITAQLMKELPAYIVAAADVIIDNATTRLTW